MRTEGARAVEELDPGVPDLVSQAKQGDHVAFEGLYRLHLGRVYAICLRVTADPVQAEILTQDAFVRAWEKLGSYRGRGTFWGWLRRLAMNVVLDDRRSGARRRRWLQGEELKESEAVTPPPETESAIDLERAIAGLPNGARLVFVLHDVHGYAYKEIAEIAGVALGTVKAQLHRARRLLRETLSRPVEAQTR
jgi:RNA polymerase sigma-70 factor (ECF subfamily)